MNLEKFTNKFDDIRSKIHPPLRASAMFVKNSNKDNLVVVEIGTEFGYNALSMLRSLPIKTMYLVDSYENYETNGRVYNSGEAEFKTAKVTLHRYRNKIKFVRKKSIDAIDDIPNDVDFVYIDGNHDYEFVKKDLELYFLKVQKGGVLGGHDWEDFGVCKAVMEFVQKNNLKLYIKRLDWWIVK